MNIKEKAKLFAIKAHKGQIRKSDKEKPMIIHPINVANILSEYGYDDNVVAAAYLHDVIEDTDEKKNYCRARGSLRAGKHSRSLRVHVHKLELQRNAGLRFFKHSACSA